MKKSILIIPVLIIIACAPQATVTLTPSSETPTKVKSPTVVFSATPDETQAPPDPEIIGKDSELNKIGIPEGATLGADESGAPIYYVTNPAGEQVIVGQKDASGNWEPGDAVRYTLSPTREEAMTNVLDYDFVMRGGPGQVAKLNGEPFPENVIAGLNVVVLIPNVKDKYYNYLYFDRNGKNIIKNHPGQEPYRNLGWFSFVNEAGQQGIGVVWQWINPDGSIVYLTTVGSAGADPGLVYTPFVSFNLTKEKLVNATVERIGKDQELNILIQQWADTDIIPAELQNHALIVRATFNP